MKYTIFLLMIFLCSCAHFSTGESAWGGGLFIIPLVVGLASGWSFYRCYISWHSGTRVDNGMNAPIRFTYTKEKQPVYTFGSFWFAIGLAVVDFWIIMGVKWDA